MHSDTYFQGFLNSTESVATSILRFEPVFLRNSKFCSEFERELKKVLYLRPFTNRMAGSNQREISPPLRRRRRDARLARKDPAHAKLRSLPPAKPAPSDPQAELIGNINRIYGVPGRTEPARNYRGTYGFITD